MNKNQFIPSVNFHLWEPCNMRCKFCFATFQDVKQTILPKGHLAKEDAINVVKKLAEYGFEKITFAGGEPTICPWLTELINTAKSYGMATMIVTNGANLTDKFLKENRKYLDWIAMSIDSLNDETNLKSGRAIIGKRVISINEYKKIITNIKRYGYGLKINTVVNASNYTESFIIFINWASPKRWKVLQVLPIEGQNDKSVDDFLINQQQFLHFINNHKGIKSLVYENNDQIKGSYVMVDPAGRFFDNIAKKYSYSSEINKVGVEKAIQQMNYDFGKFINRKGIYDWKS